MATRYNFKCSSCGEEFDRTDIECCYCGSYESHDTTYEIELQKENTNLQSSLSAMTKRAEEAEADNARLRGAVILVKNNSTMREGYEGEPWVQIPEGFWNQLMDALQPTNKKE